jgi:uncharacterized membrane protein
MKDFLKSLYEDHKEFFKKIIGSLTDLIIAVLLYGLEYLRELLNIKFRNNYSS